MASYRTDDLSVRLEGRPGLSRAAGWQRRELRRSPRGSLSRSQHRFGSGTRVGFHTVVTEFRSDPKITRPL